MSAENRRIIAVPDDVWLRLEQLSENSGITPDELAISCLRHQLQPRDAIEAATSTAASLESENAEERRARVSTSIEDINHRFGGMLKRLAQ